MFCCFLLCSCIYLIQNINLPAETQTSYFFNSSINFNGKKTNNKSRKKPFKHCLKLLNCCIVYWFFCILLYLYLFILFPINFHCFSWCSSSFLVVYSFSLFSLVFPRFCYLSGQFPIYSFLGHPELGMISAMEDGETLARASRPAVQTQTSEGRRATGSSFS